MDKRNKNIEDFFNKSLAQFNDAPSDSVWAGIAQQLDYDKPPFYKLWKFWVRTFIGITALFLLSWGYYSTHKAIDMLTLKTTQLAQENEQLKLALNDCSIESESVISAKESTTTRENLVAKELQNAPKPNNNQRLKSKRITRTPFFTPSYYSPIQNVAFSSFDKKASIYYPKTAALFSSTPYQPSLLRSSKNDTSTKESEILAAKNIIGSDLSEEEMRAIKKRGFPKLAKLYNPNNGDNRIKSNFKRPLPSSFINYASLPITQVFKKKLDYRFGWSFGGMNTFTDKNDLFGPGYNNGFTSEWLIFKKIYLTTAIHHVQQNYEIKLNADNQGILQTYPGIEELTNVVTSINQHSHYLEFPIGLKWYFKDQQNGTKFYANPSLAWHFYFPQKFKYEQASNNGISTSNYTNDQYFGYLGTAQMQIGLEKPLFKRMHYQVGLWGEKSLIPMGVENRSLLNIGIRGAILFN